MAEYIDLDTPLEVYVERGGFCKQQITTLRELLDTNKIPYTAADVASVRHGQWIPHSKVETPVFHCSVCGGAALHAFGKQCKSDFCPNCGAKMDKDGDGE